MLALMNRILDWFRSLFWKEEMELTLVGLQYSGKTTFVNDIAVSSSRFQKFKFMFYLFVQRSTTKTTVVSFCYYC